MRISRHVFISLAVLALASFPVLAFHDGGVAHCNGCHTMHNSPDNPTGNGSANPLLLKQATPTDVCTMCHDTSYGSTWGADVLTPGNIYGGGQFVFLLEDNLNDGHAGATNPIPGYQAGHNVISTIKGTLNDPVNTMAPGGTYLSAFMHCTSCHDPHGKGGHFRLLYGDDYPISSAMGYDYTYNAPAPTADPMTSFFGPGESQTNHTGYQAGMSEWCGNCHGAYHNTNYPTTLIHPSGSALELSQITAYDIYNGTGHYDGSHATAYTMAVPFEDATSTHSNTAGPATTSKVMCLTCHRAHASSGPNSGRWDFNITEYLEEGVESGSYKIPNPYAGTSGDAQRSLCNKCHLQDPE